MDSLPEAASFSAVILGEACTKLPDDLFIPPDALLVLLDSFSGPLDLLLYLIRKQNIDVLDIPIVTITQQYMQYIELMEYHRMELAAEYLLMAAMLAEIKARMLLPAPPCADDEEDIDPRMALVKRLQAYEYIKAASELLDALPRAERDFFPVRVDNFVAEQIVIHPHVALDEITLAIQDLVKREGHKLHHQISREVLSVRERMSFVLSQLNTHKTLAFSSLFTLEEGRMGLVVSLLALLELSRQSLVVIIQTKPFSPIHIQAV